MHKAVILLTKADTVSEAQKNAEEFLHSYGEGRVWDWYVIGGRWSGTLNSKTQEFYNECEERVPIKHKAFGPSSKEIEENQSVYEDIWKEIGGQGNHPFNRDAYSNDGAVDDTIPLKNCIDIVKDWEVDRTYEADKEYTLLKESYDYSHDADPHHTKSSAAYHADKFKNWIWDCFCFDSNTYDIDMFTNDVPTEDIDKYWAVLVDMHN